MNKKLLSLAVAAAVAAPTAAMAEAVLYGRVHVSIDYADVTNSIAPTYDEVEYFNVTGIGPATETSTATNIYATQAAAAANAGPNTPGFLAQAEDVPAWVNSTGGTVYVPLADGTVAEVQDGTLIEGFTSSSTTMIVPGPDGEMVTLIRTDGAGNPIINNDGQDFTGWGVASEGSEIPGSGRASRLGVKGSEDLGNGLKAIYQIELGLNLGDDDITSGSNGISYRNTFAGIAGDFGTLLVGRHDTPLKISTGKLDMFSDTMADYNGTVGFDDLRVDNAIAYISPSFAGFSFAGALVAPGGGTDGEGVNINSDQLNGAYSLALIYRNGPFHGSAAYESISNEMFMDSETSLAGKEQCIGADGTPTLTCGYVDNDYAKWRLGLGLLDWNGFTLTAIYEQQDDLPDGQTRQMVGFVDPDGNVTFDSLTGGAEEQRLWQVQAGYSFGNNMVKAMYGAVDRDADKPFSRTRDTLSINNITDDLGGDRETWAIGFDHNFSKRTKAYALYVDVSDDSNGLPNGELEWSGFSLGLLHKF
ncbi:porin [uncultured Thiohalocapsa sp.]|uniref:porin n=1 Tax=uncultured Thiohalocapsa sp. TaxID=768990 RepID=UPI0025EE06DC|nr:porin [uncultured Thiohalocapsa sp.]